MISSSLIVYLIEAENAFTLVLVPGIELFAITAFCIRRRTLNCEFFLNPVKYFRCLCSPKQLLNLCMLTATSHLCSDRIGIRTYLRDIGLLKKPPMLVLGKIIKR